MRDIIVAYLYESDWRERVNARGENYWYEYIEQINDQLGLCADKVTKSSLERKIILEKVSVLIIGDLHEKDLTKAIVKNLKEWVSSGGILIGMATEGLDEIFGNDCVGIIEQNEFYECSGYFTLEKDILTKDIHSSLVPSQKLLIFAAIKKILTINSKKLASLYNEKNKPTRCAAITKRNYGKGIALYFAFNLPQTIWVLHQGRPVTYDIDGDGYCKASDLSVIGSNSGRVLYADELLFLLQNMIGQRRNPFIYQIPPIEKSIPKALFFWGGDDEFVEGAQLAASNWMKKKRLPYHINVLFQDGNFNLKEDEVKAVHENNHEISLHYNFIDGNTAPYFFRKEDVRKQAKAFKETFGFTHECSVNHYTLWNGWAAPAKWMASTGQLADNSFYYNCPDRPLFAYGTAYPFFFYSNWQEGNKKINLIEEVITAYELGYHRNKTKEDLTVDKSEIHDVIDTAVKYHLCINMFYHTYRIRDWPAACMSIEESLNYIRRNNLFVIHMANNELAHWWIARSQSEILSVEADDESMQITASCEWRKGMIVKVPIGKDKASSIQCDGKKAIYENIKEFRQNWVYIICPYGKHEIELVFNKNTHLKKGERGGSYKLK